MLHVGLTAASDNSFKDWIQLSNSILLQSLSGRSKCPHLAFRVSIGGEQTRPGIKKQQQKQQQNETNKGLFT